MELKEFIKETLTEIFDGIMDAQKSLSESGGFVNPAHISHNIKDQVHVGERGKRYAYTPAYLVDFEVSLTEIETVNKKKGVGVAFSVIGVGAEKSKGGENASLTKVKFSIPVSYPFQE